THEDAGRRPVEPQEAPDGSYQHEKWQHCRRVGRQGPDQGEGHGGDPGHAAGEGVHVVEHVERIDQADNPEDARGAKEPAALVCTPSRNCQGRGRRSSHSPSTTMPSPSPRTRSNSGERTAGKKAVVTTMPA